MLNEELNGENILESAMPEIPDHALLTVLKNEFGIEAAISPLTGERDRNFRTDAADGRRFVLKVINPAEPRAISKFQGDALEWIADKTASGHTVPAPRIIATHSGLTSTLLTLPDGRKSVVRLLTYLEGEPLYKLARTAAQRRSIGKCLANLDLALAGAPAPQVPHVLQWDLKHAAALRSQVHAVENQPLRSEIEQIIGSFEAHVVPVLPSLRTQVIHNDFNPHNLLMSHEDHDAISGIIDFGDIVFSPLVMDLAIACAYQIDPGTHPLATISEVAAAYHEILPLQQSEIEILLDLIRARLITTIVVTSWRARRYPENRDYILRTAPRALASLDQLRGVERSAAIRYIAQACKMKDRA